MYPYAIGLDIGITSVGWAVVALDESEKPCGIIKMGSRIFDAAENPKNGASLALPRREARSMRRRLRRHRHRNERIRQLLLSSALLSESELEHLFEGQLEDIYALRVRALDEMVSRQEFARILIHLSQRRGFRSNRKGGATKEDGLLLTAVGENLRKMEEGHYRTAAELLLNDPVYQEHKRNKGGQYISTVSRDMVENEVHTIFASQRSHGNETATAELEENYLSILLSQRSFDDGPGGNSPYIQGMSMNRIGQCTFEEGELRAAKATYSFEYFTLLEKINHLRLIQNGISLPLTEEQRRCLIDAAHQTDTLDFSRIRKLLAVDESFTFNAVRYETDVPQETSEKKTKFVFLKAYHQMRKAFEKQAKGRFSTLSSEQKDAIGGILTYYKTEAKIREALFLEDFTPEDIEIILTIGSFSKYGHLSLIALRKLIPYLEQGMNYNDACTAAGYSFKGHEDTIRSHLLHITEEDTADITSPVVRRAISQTAKVVNAIIRDRGISPTFINIELARELAKDFMERNRAIKEMDENRARNDRIMERLKSEFHLVDPSGEDLIKLRLYEEQGGVCPYSQKAIRIERLFEKGYAEVDHIVPYSISFDNSYRNKVLVLAKENRDKGNRLPLEYMIGSQKDNFIVWVNAEVRDYRKRQKLLKEHVTEEDETNFKERNLQDTKTMSRFLMNYLNDHLEFAPSERRRKRVTAVSGTITSYLRKRWGITKIRENGDLHHAVDALVIACATDGLIAQISRYAKWRECRYLPGETTSLAVDPETGEVLKEFPLPWPYFRQELFARLSSDPEKVLRDLDLPFYRKGDIPAAPLFVSRMPKRTVTGAAHKETYRQAAKEAIGGVVTKTELTKLALSNGEIQHYYEPAKASDPLLYEALKEQLIKYGGDAKRAFAAPFRKPKADGTPGPIVNKVKLWEASTVNVPVLNGSAVAAHDKMVRVDVFRVENDGYYLVPIYVADTLLPQLPNKACVAHKPYAEWKVMKEEDFLFSLYPNDLLYVEHSKALSLMVANKKSTLDPSVSAKSGLFYYMETNISSGKLTCRTHDGSYETGFGAKTIARLEKYTVDILGEYHKVTKEPRLPFTGKRG